MSAEPTAVSSTFTAEFLRGAGDVWRGAGCLLKRPRLWPWAAAPFVLNVCLFVALCAGMWHFVGGWIGEHLMGEGFWWSALGWLIGGLIWIATLVLVVVLFVPLATLIAAPFNDMLSEKVEALYAGLEPAPFTWRLLWRSIVVPTLSGLRLAAVTLGLLALTLPLHLIPVIGSIAATAAASFITIRFLALEYTSYSMDRRCYNYGRRRAFLRRHHARTLGLGAMAFVLMMAPILNALFISVSAVAGTLLFCDTEASAQSSGTTQEKPRMDTDQHR